MLHITLLVLNVGSHGIVRLTGIALHVCHKDAIDY